MKLCICDLDGVVCDNTARFAKAEEAKQAYRRSPASITDEEGEMKAVNIFWREAFNPSYVVLDTLIEGVKEALDTLYGEYGVLFLTSRPESMREATVDWLEAHDISVEHPQFGNFLICKPPAFQFVRTSTWKAGTIQMLHRLFGADELLVLEDEQVN